MQKPSFEKFVTNLSTHAVEKRKRNAGLFMLAVCILASSLPRVYTDNSVESFLTSSDRELLRYREFQEVFGDDRLILVGVHSRIGWSDDFVDLVESIHEDIEDSVPHVADVTSIVNVRHTTAIEDGIEVQPLFAGLPSGGSRSEHIRQRLESAPIYEKTVIGRDFDSVAILLEPAMGSAGPDELGGFEESAAAETNDETHELSLAQNAELLDALMVVLERHDRPGVDIEVSGEIPDNDRQLAILAQDAALSVVGSLLLNGLLLLLIYRSWGAAIAPMASVILSLVATFGLMGLIGIPFSSTLSILPRIVIVVAISNAVHIISAYHAQTSTDVVERIRSAMTRTAAAIVLASLTTAAAMGSFAGVGLAQTSNLGRIAPLGILIALGSSFVIVPVVLSSLPMGDRRRSSAEGLQKRVGEAMGSIGRGAAESPLLVAGATMAILALAAVGISRLEMRSHPLQWLPDGDPIRQAAEANSEAFGGVVSLEVLVDSQVEDGAKSLEFLRKLGEADAFLDEYRDEFFDLSGAVSVLDILRETNRALNDGRESEYRLPASDALVAQELFLFQASNPDDIRDVLDSEYRVARLSSRVPYVDQMQYPALVARLQNGLDAILGDVATVEITGATNLLSRSAVLLSSAMIESYAIAIVLIGCLMILALQNVRAGLVSMIPNLIPVVATLGVMGWAGFPLDTSIMIVGCVILGLAVDDTIHFMHEFRRQLPTSQSPEEAVEGALRRVGPALLTTTVVLVFGFLPAMAAYLNNIFQFGVAALVGVVTALLSDLVVAPALVALAFRKRGEAEAMGRVGPAA